MDCEVLAWKISGIVAVIRQRISVSLVYMWLAVLFTRFFVVSFGKSNGIINLRTINLKQVGN